MKLVRPALDKHVQIERLPDVVDERVKIFFDKSSPQDLVL